MIATAYALARDTDDMQRATERVERALLGAVMTARVVPPNTPAVDDFLTEAHRVIWRAIMARVAQGQEPDLTSVMYELAKTDGATGRASGDAYVASCLDSTDCSSLTDYARMVKEAAQLRKLKRTGV
jgi:replicative DNA helicase